MHLTIVEFIYDAGHNLFKRTILSLRKHLINATPERRLADQRAIAIAVEKLARSIPGVEDDATELGALTAARRALRVFRVLTAALRDLRRSEEIRDAAARRCHLRQDAAARRSKPTK